MSRRKRQTAERRCACGAPLAWEARETFRGSRSLALCSNPDCGRWVTTSHDACDDEDLRTFLLGDAPVRRELRPWTRFFFRAASLGYRWTAAPERCSDCGDEATSALQLDWNTERFADPFLVILCTRCGHSTLSYWIASERLITALAGEAWLEPEPQIALLKRALIERSRRATENHT
jgi:hypothetical protein